MKKTIYTIAGILAALVIFFLGKSAPATPVTVGSINDGQAYTASSTTSNAANTYTKLKVATTTAGVTTNNQTSGVLGSVVITGTSATVVELRDATSSSDVASTSLATFAASAPAGTYTFDVSFSRGLIANYTGSFAGNYIITWR